MSDEALTRHARDWERSASMAGSPTLHPRLKRCSAASRFRLWCCGRLGRRLAPDYGRGYAALIPARASPLSTVRHHRNASGRTPADQYPRFLDR